MPSAPTSLSIVIPAYNEEANLAITVARAIESAAAVFPGELEIVIVNDCSNDGTLVVAQDLASKHPSVRVVSNPVNLGFGGAYKRGVEAATKSQIMMIPGDDAYPVEALRAILSEVGRADIVMSYTSNLEVRPIGRQLISHAFTAMMNLLFFMRLKYFNGVTVLPSREAKALDPSDGFSYSAENLVRLIKVRGFSYREVPAAITERNSGRSTALSLRNFWFVARGLASLFAEVHFTGPKRAKAAKDRR